MTDIQERARSLTQKAMDTLDAVMDDELAKPSERIAAANAVLDRAYGKPIAAVVSIPVRGAIAEQLYAMSDDALMQVVREGRIGQRLLDVTPGTPQNEGPKESHGKSQPVVLDAKANRSAQSAPREGVVANSNERGTFPQSPGRPGGLIRSFLKSLASSNKQSVDPLAE